MKNILIIINDNPVDHLGVMYLTGNVNANFEVLFIKDQNDKRLDNINISKYDILGFSTITGSHLIHNEIAKYFKKKDQNILTLMGGPHPTFFPKESLDLSHIDYICMGEGTIALEKFINGNKTYNIINDYKDYTGILDPIHNINKLNINRDVIYKIDNRGDNPIKNFMGTFGCPFNCSYCFNFSYNKLYEHQNGKRVRYRNPELFIEDIKNCVNNYYTKFLYIQDDIFIINKKWFTKVTDLIKKEINLPYHCHIRIDVTTEETIKQLKETGCTSVTFAIEDANEKYRKIYLNRKESNEKILQVSKLLHKYGIKFRIENMVGLPFNTLQDNIKTLNLNYDCHPTIGWASLFQPFTNTELGNIAKSANLWSGNIDDIKSGFFDKSSLKIENKEKVERLQKLFSLGINNKFIKKIIPILIRLPLDNIYKKIYTKFKNNKYNELYKYE
jgi:anaerobic magnesium-protoporphyrin IX monomethyl ester cyclase